MCIQISKIIMSRVWTNSEYFMQSNRALWIHYLSDVRRPLTGQAAICANCCADASTMKAMTAIPAEGPYSLSSKTAYHKIEISKQRGMSQARPHGLNYPFSSASYPTQPVIMVLLIKWWESSLQFVPIAALIVEKWRGSNCSGLGHESKLAIY